MTSRQVRQKSKWGARVVSALDDAIRDRSGQIPRGLGWRCALHLEVDRNTTPAPRGTVRHQGRSVFLEAAKRRWLQGRPSQPRPERGRMDASFLIASFNLH